MSGNSDMNIGTVSNEPLASVPGREYHPPILGRLGAHGIYYRPWFAPC